MHQISLSLSHLNSFYFDLYMIEAQRRSKLI